MCDKKLFPISANEQQEISLQVQCPFCGALPNIKCTTVIFPQYPHTPRLQKSLIENYGWTREEIKREYFGDISV